MKSDHILELIKAPSVPNLVEYPYKIWYETLLNQISFENTIIERQQILTQLKILDDLGYEPASLSLKKIYSLGGWVAKDSYIFSDAEPGILNTKLVYTFSNWFDTLRVNFVRLSKVLNSVNVHMRWLSRVSFFGWSTYLYLVLVDMAIIAKNIYTDTAIIGMIGLNQYLYALLNKGDRKNRLISAALWLTLGVVSLYVPTVVAVSLAVAGIGFELARMSYAYYLNKLEVNKTEEQVRQYVVGEHLDLILAKLSQKLKNYKVEMIAANVIGLGLVVGILISMMPGLMLAGVITTFGVSFLGLVAKVYSSFAAKSEIEKKPTDSEGFVHSCSLFKAQPRDQINGDEHVLIGLK